MQSQQVRDDKTLVIMTSLGLGVVVLVAGALLLWGVYVVLAPSDSTLGMLMWSVMLGACLVVAARLVRHRRSDRAR